MNYVQMKPTELQMPWNLTNAVPADFVETDCGVINGIRICWTAISVQLTLIS